MKKNLRSSLEENLQIFLTCASLWIFMLEQDPKNIFNYTDQVLNLLLFDKYEYQHRIFQSIILVSTFMLRVHVTFSLFLGIWLTESISEEFTSCWLLTLCHNFLLMKISSIRWNDTWYTSKAELWQKVASQCQIS